VLMMSSVSLSVCLFVCLFVMMQYLARGRTRTTRNFGILIVAILLIYFLI